jgi:RND family efflux transporter MFP subunit
MLEASRDCSRDEGLAADLASLRIDRSTERLPRRPRGRGVLVAVSLLGVVAAGGIATPRVLDRVRRTTVTTTTVVAARSDAREVLLTASGYVVADTVAQVGARVAGRLARVRVREGDSVAEGDVIAELDDGSARATLLAATAHASAVAARAEAARATAHETLAQAQRERSLVLAGASPRSAADDLEMRLASLVAAARASEAEARAADTDLAPLRVALADHVIRAPQRGVVLARPMRPGEIVSPGPGGTPVAVLYDPGSLGVDVDVPEGRLSIVRVGAEADVALDAYPDKALKARVERIGRHVDRAKGSVPVRLVFVAEAAEALPDMSARASFLGPESERTTIATRARRTVSQKAVVERAGAKVVFAVDRERARMLPVKTGATRGGAVEIEEGPAAGTTLVLDPPSSLVDGQRIEEEKNR